MVHCVFLDEATARQDEIECMKFVSGVLYDEANPTHRQSGEPSPTEEEPLSMR